ncbi:MAG: hypothetical protein QG611_1114, partial [Bacteroidota bacterium]|nr:hypothetical protein [Bacteroidota bacterium]
MKILMLLENDYESDSRVKKEVQALHEAGFEVIVAAIKKSGSDTLEKRKNCLLYKKKISSLVLKTSVGALKFPFYFNFWRRYLKEIIKVHRIDVVHVNDLPLCRIGSELKKQSGVKFVADLHENWPALIKNARHTRTCAGKLLSSDKQWRKYEKEVLKDADLIITVIDEARDRILKMGTDPSKICMVSNTINPDDISLITVTGKNDLFTIFYGGAINQHRGLQVVLESIFLLSQKSIKINLHIVGSGSFRSDLEKQAARLGISSRIRFSGQKSFHEMLDLLAEADAAIIPHLRTENNDASSPNKLYQYMYLNKPIISSD